MTRHTHLAGAALIALVSLGTRRIRRGTRLRHHERQGSGREGHARRRSWRCDQVRRSGQGSRPRRHTGGTGSLYGAGADRCGVRQASRRSARHADEAGSASRPHRRAHLPHPARHDPHGRHRQGDRRRRRKTLLATMAGGTLTATGGQRDRHGRWRGDQGKIVGSERRCRTAPFSASTR